MEEAKQGVEKLVKNIIISLREAWCLSVARQFDVYVAPFSSAMNSGKNYTAIGYVNGSSV